MSSYKRLGQLEIMLRENIATSTTIIIYLALKYLNESVFNRPDDEAADALSFNMTHSVY